MRRILFATPFIICLILLACFSLQARQANLRQHYTGGWSAMRPGIFHVERSGVVPLGSDLAPLGDFVDKDGLGPAELPPKLGIDGRTHARAATSLSASAEVNTLVLVVDCREPEPELMASARDDYYADGRVVIDLDLNHDHHTFTRIVVWPWGQHEITAHQVSSNHLAWDSRASEVEPSLEYSVSAAKTDGGWTARVEITLPGPVDDWRAVGLNAQRLRGVHGEEISMWSPDHNRVNNPLNFGDLYLGEPPATVESVRLGTVCWGDNSGEMTLDSPAGSLQLGVQTRNYREKVSDGQYEFVNDRAGFGWFLDPRDIMHGELHLALGGRAWGSYQFGWKRSILLTHRPTSGYNAPRPSPGEEGYYWQFLRYVLDRLPRLERSADGTVLTDGLGISIDLTGPDPLGQLAAIVMRRFSTDEERLTAATMLLCQQGVMVSSGTGERLVHPQDGLGVLHTGAAFCNSYGELLRDLVIRIQDSGGEYFRANVLNYIPGEPNTFGWPHHWLCGVAYGDGLTLIDAELGTVFIDPSTGRLATLEQLIAGPDLADLTAYGLGEYFRGRRVKDFMVREDGDLLRE